MFRNFAAALVLALLPLQLFADIIKLKDGRAIDGKILEDTPEKIVVEIQHGASKAKMTILRESIVSIEKSRSKDEEYAERRALVKDDDYPGQLELARWCIEKALKPEAGRHLLQIVTRAATAPEALDAKKLLVKLGYKEFPKVGWMTEDDYWGPKGFVRGGSGWVTKECSIAEAGVTKAKKELDAIRTRGDFQDGVLGDQKDAYNALSSEYNKINDRRNQLIEDWKVLRGKALDALNNLTTVSISEGDWDALSVDSKGNLVRSNGTIVLVTSTFNMGAWTAFQGCVKGMKAEDKEIKAAEPKLKRLTGEMETIAAKAKKQEKSAGKSDRDEERAKESLDEAQKKLDEAREDMKGKMGNDGLPKE